MRLPLFLPLLAAALHTAAAQPAAAPLGRETALDNLLSERESDKALDAAITAARKSGISEQAILEARFLYHVDRHEDKAIAAMLPGFLKQRDLFKLADSEIFATSDDWLAVVEYVRAIDSLVKGDKAAFKTHITEAFWLSPRQAAAFAPHIERMRLDDAMSAVKIDFDTRLLPLAGGDPVALETLITGKKALLLHFWSPASPECENSMPDFIATATALGEKGIAVASLVEDGEPEILTNARKMIQPLGLKPPGAWLVDSKHQPLGRELRVRTLPLFILVSNEGRVLFNGDPADDAFWEKLGQLDPRITRPGMDGSNR
jgi:hypothetical protein